MCICEKGGNFADKTTNLLVSMKKITLFLAFLLAVCTMQAQENFQGVMKIKMMTSYSKAYLKLVPGFVSGVDTLEAYIKGDAVHLYSKQTGIHKIYKDGMLWYYSENVKQGFVLPAPPPYSGELQIIDKNDTRTFLGQECAVKTYLLLFNNFTTEVDCWLAENAFNISAVALDNINNNVYGADMSHKIAMKVSLRTSMSGNMDMIIGSSKITQAVMMGSENKGGEMSSSKIYEVMDIQPVPIDDSRMVPAGDIEIEKVIVGAGTSGQHDAEAIKAALMADPKIRKKVESGKADIDDLVADYQEKMKKRMQEEQEKRDKVLEKGVRSSVFLGKDTQKALQKTLDDGKAVGITADASAYGAALFRYEGELLTKNMEYLKNNKKIVKEEENVQPVVYDLDDEWDF